MNAAVSSSLDTSSVVQQGLNAAITVTVPSTTVQVNQSPMFAAALSQPRVNVLVVSGPQGPMGPQGSGVGNLTGQYPIFYDAGSGIVGIVSGYYVTFPDLTSASGALVAQISAASAGVNALNGLSGFVSLAAVQPLYISAQGQTLYISGSGLVSSGDLSAASGVLSSSVEQTGSSLYSLITGNTGYANLSGYITTGQADLRYYPLTSNPSGFITTGQTGQFYPASNPQHYATSGDLSGVSGVLASSIAATGASIYSLVTGFSGQGSSDYATKTELTQTGVLLGGQITALSGFVTGISGHLDATITATGQQSVQYTDVVGSILSGDLSQTGSIVLGLLEQTGSQAWNAANDNGLNLSGNLALTGSQLTSSLLAFSGWTLGMSGGLEYRIFLTGQAAVNHANGIGVNLSGNLLATGTSLQGQINNLTLGTASATWQLESGASGIKLKNTPSGLYLRNYLDTALADLTVYNLTVVGTQTINNTNNLAVGNQYIYLNVSGVAQDAGIIPYRSGMTAAAMIWSESNMRWMAGLSGTESIVVLASDTGNFVYRDLLTQSGAVLNNLITGASGVLANSIAQTGSNLYNTITALSGTTDNMFVHRTGNELISGDKSFTGKLSIGTNQTLDGYPQLFVSRSGFTPPSSLYTSDMMVIAANDRNGFGINIVAANYTGYVGATGYSVGQRGVFKATRARLSDPKGTGFEAVGQSDIIASFLGAGYDGYSTIASAGINTQVDGLVSSGIVPQSIVFEVGNGSGLTPRSERMRITSSGYVGIGVSNPTFPLVVNGRIQSFSATDGHVDFGVSMFDRVAMDWDEVGFIGRIQGLRTGFNNAPITINASGGNVGINIPQPQVSLHLSGGLLIQRNEVFDPRKNVSGAISISGDYGGGIVLNDLGSGYAGIWTSEYGQMLSLAVGGNASSGFSGAFGPLPYGQINLTGGKLGVGIVPSFPLHVNGAIATSGQLEGDYFPIRITNTATGVNARAKILFTLGENDIASIDAYPTGGLGLVSRYNNSGYIDFVTRTQGTFAGRVRITNSGYVGVGTSSPSYPLHVLNNASGAANVIAGFSSRRADNIYLRLDNLEYSGSGIGLFADNLGGIGFHRFGLNNILAIDSGNSVRHDGPQLLSTGTIRAGAGFFSGTGANVANLADLLYPRSNPSGYITGLAGTGSLASLSQLNSLSGFVLGASGGLETRIAQTGSNLYNTINSLSGYTETIYVHRTGSELISGHKAFVNTIAVGSTGSTGATSNIYIESALPKIALQSLSANVNSRGWLLQTRVAPTTGFQIAPSNETGSAEVPGWIMLRNGNIGVGLTNPAQKLVVSGGIVFSDTLLSGTTNISDLFYPRSNPSGYITGLAGTGSLATLTQLNSLSGFILDASGGLETRIAQTGAASIVYINSVGTNLSGNLIQTGSLLSALRVSGSSVMNNADMTGVGTVTVWSSGTRIYVSGRNSDAVNLSGVIATTGSQAWNAANNNGINLSGNLTITGQTLQIRIDSLSGYVALVSGGLETRIALTGQQNAAYTNGVGQNLSGNLTQTGIVLMGRDLLVSGWVSTGIALTGSTLANKIDSLSGWASNPITTVSANYSVLVSDRRILCNNTSPITLTFPSAVVSSGIPFRVKLINTGYVYLTGTAGQTFDGSSLYSVVGQYSAHEVMSNGSNYYMF